MRVCLIVNWKWVTGLLWDFIILVPPPFQNQPYYLQAVTFQQPPSIQNLSHRHHSTWAIILFWHFASVVQKWCGHNEHGKKDCKSCNCWRWKQGRRRHFNGLSIMSTMFLKNFKNKLFCLRPHRSDVVNLVYIVYDGVYIVPNSVYILLIMKASRVHRGSASWTTCSSCV